MRFCMLYICDKYLSECDKFLLHIDELFYPTISISSKPCPIDRFFIPLNMRFSMRLETMSCGCVMR